MPRRCGVVAGSNPAIAAKLNNMIVEVVELVEGPTYWNGNYSVKVKAKNPMGNIFQYQFIKNHKSDADKIVVGFTWEMNSKRKWL